MTREETRQAIEVMQHFADGGEVEYGHQVDEIKEWFKATDPVWDWNTFCYRIAKPEPVSIPITEEEKLKIIYVSVKEKDTEQIYRLSIFYTLREKEKYYFLNPKTQCWEEWSEELERELMK